MNFIVYEFYCVAGKVQFNIFRHTVAELLSLKMMLNENSLRIPFTVTSGPYLVIDICGNESRYTLSPSKL